MPTLNWIGKDKIITHDQDVPFKILDHQYGFTAGKGEQKTETNSGNMIIHGDNLEALKSLLPKYEGKIKCIYIDPPYNTGNENWVYNDNVNSPKIKKWLGEIVGKEGEDLTRHDKWLCMMYPRLKLLHRLLANDGAIFISIDDNEYTNLKMMCDEIFGQSHYISSFIWKRRSSSQMASNKISIDHEYVLTYSKSDIIFKGFEKKYSNYKNPDNDIRGPWTTGDLTVGMTAEQRPNQYYDLIDPLNGNTYPANAKRVWTYAPETMAKKIAEGRVIFPKTKSGRPLMKRFQSDLKSDIDPISSILLNEDYNIGLNSEATKVLQEIFNEKVFDYSKPMSLVKVLIDQLADKNAIILDSFAGSGTTAHAVLNLNKEDGGKRKFILIEMEDYADSITAERVKRVAKGYGADKKQIEGTGGAFDYYVLGEPLFDDNQNLNESIGIEKIREYIWFSETRTAFTEPQADPYFLGSHSDTAYYFVYEKDSLTTLDYDALQLVKHKSEQYIIYADNCLLPKEFMTQHHIIFKKIPRDITRF